MEHHTRTEGFWQAHLQRAVHRARQRAAQRAEKLGGNEAIHRPAASHREGGHGEDGQLCHPILRTIGQARAGGGRLLVQGKRCARLLHQAAKWRHQQQDTHQARTRWHAGDRDLGEQKEHHSHHHRERGANATAQCRRKRTKATPHSHQQLQKVAEKPAQAATAELHKRRGSHPEQREKPLLADRHQRAATQADKRRRLVVHLRETGHTNQQHHDRRVSRHQPHAMGQLPPAAARRPLARRRKLDCGRREAIHLPLAKRRLGHPEQPWTEEPRTAKPTGQVPHQGGNTKDQPPKRKEHYRLQQRAVQRTCKPTERKAIERIK